MAISGSFVLGNDSGRAILPFSVINDRFLDASNFYPTIAINDKFLDVSTTQSITIRDNVAEPGSVGYLQGLAYWSPTSLDGQGSFGRHMQVGINKETVIGNPIAPSLRLDYPGFWRFRWVVKSGARSISVLANQNSTGSYRPTMIVKSNASVNLTNDLSASAPTVPGWTTIGPINFTAVGSDVVWVELHNNNYGVINVDGRIITAPAYFDHIVVN